MTIYDHPDHIYMVIYSDIIPLVIYDQYMMLYDKLFLYMTPI